MTPPKQPHRGRTQVQGRDINKELSRSWAQEVPKDAGEAHDELDEMRRECSRRQQQRRNPAFHEAHRFISNAQAYGGVHAPISESFPRSARRRSSEYPSARVDIEVQTGKAFV